VHQRGGSGVSPSSSSFSAGGGNPRAPGDAREGGRLQAARDGYRHVVRGHDARGRPPQSPRARQGDG